MNTFKLSEHELQEAVIDLAHTFKWRVAHFRSIRMHGGGYQTPVQADGGGFPDLVLVRDRVIFAELKSENGRMSTAQMDWMFALGKADAERHIWYPRDWHDGTIEKLLA